MGEIMSATANTTEVFSLASKMMSVSDPERLLQQSLAATVQHNLRKSYPGALVFFCDHRYLVFLQMSFFRYLLFVIFSRKSLMRDMISEMKEVDDNFDDLVFVDKLSEKAVKYLP